MRFDVRSSSKSHRTFVCRFFFSSVYNLKRSIIFTPFPMTNREYVVNFETRNSNTCRTCENKTKTACAPVRSSRILWTGYRMVRENEKRHLFVSRIPIFRRSGNTFRNRKFEAKIKRFYGTHPFIK